MSLIAKNVDQLLQSVSKMITTISENKGCALNLFASFVLPIIDFFKFPKNIQYLLYHREKRVDVFAALDELCLLCDYYKLPLDWMSEIEKQLKCLSIEPQQLAELVDCIIALPFIAETPLPGMPSTPIRAPILKEELKKLSVPKKVTFAAAVEEPRSTYSEQKKKAPLNFSTVFAKMLAEIVNASKDQEANVAADELLAQAKQLALQPSIELAVAIKFVQFFFSVEQKLDDNRATQSFFAVANDRQNDRTNVSESPLVIAILWQCFLVIPAEEFSQLSHILSTSSMEHLLKLIAKIDLPVHLQTFFARHLEAFIESKTVVAKKINYRLQHNPSEYKVKKKKYPISSTDWNLKDGLRPIIQMLNAVYVYKKIVSKNKDEINKLYEQILLILADIFARVQDFSAEQLSRALQNVSFQDRLLILSASINRAKMFHLLFEKCEIFRDLTPEDLTVFVNQLQEFFTPELKMEKTILQIVKMLQVTDNARAEIVKQFISDYLKNASIENISQLYRAACRVKNNFAKELIYEQVKGMLNKTSDQKLDDRFDPHLLWTLKTRQLLSQQQWEDFLEQGGMSDFLEKRGALFSAVLECDGNLNEVVAELKGIESRLFPDEGFASDSDTSSPRSVSPVESDSGQENAHPVVISSPPLSKKVQNALKKLNNLIDNNALLTEELSTTETLIASAYTIFSDLSYREQQSFQWLSETPFQTKIYQALINKSNRLFGPFIEALSFCQKFSDPNDRQYYIQKMRKRIRAIHSLEDLNQLKEFFVTEFSSEEVLCSSLTRYVNSTIALRQAMVEGEQKIQPVIAPTRIDGENIKEILLPHHYKLQWVNDQRNGTIKLYLQQAGAQAFQLYECGVLTQEDVMPIMEQLKQAAALGFLAPALTFDENSSLAYYIRKSLVNPSLSIVDEIKSERLLTDQEVTQFVADAETQLGEIGYTAKKIANTLDLTQKDLSREQMLCYYLVQNAQARKMRVLLAQIKVNLAKVSAKFEKGSKPWLLSKLLRFLQDDFSTWMQNPSSPDPKKDFSFLLILNEKVSLFLNESMTWDHLLSFVSPYKQQTELCFFQKRAVDLLFATDDSNLKIQLLRPDALDKSSLARSYLLKEYSARGGFWQRISGVFHGIVSFFSSNRYKFQSLCRHAVSGKTHFEDSSSSKTLIDFLKVETTADAAIAAIKDQGYQKFLLKNPKAFADLLLGYTQKGVNLSFLFEILLEHEELSQSFFVHQLWAPLVEAMKVKNQVGTIDCALNLVKKYPQEFASDPKQLDNLKLIFRDGELARFDPAIKTDCPFFRKSLFQVYTEHQCRLPLEFTELNEDAPQTHGNDQPTIITIIQKPSSPPHIVKVPPASLESDSRKDEAVLPSLQNQM